MSSRRILVLYGKSLFAQAIQNLLKKREELEVIGLDLDQSGVVHQVASLHPEAVIVDCDDLNVYGRSLILQVLNESPDAKILCITVNGNSIDIYRKRQVEVTKTDELVEVITSA